MSKCSDCLGTDYREAALRRTTAYFVFDEQRAVFVQHSAPNVSVLNKLLTCQQGGAILVALIRKWRGTH